MAVKSTGQLDALEGKLENGLKSGLILSGDLVAQRAQLKSRVKTGRMKRSITRGNPVMKGQSGEIDIGSNVEYFPIHELGKERIKAQAMIVPSLDESKDDIKTILGNSIAGALKG